MGDDNDVADYKEQPELITRIIYDPWGNGKIEFDNVNYGCIVMKSYEPNASEPNELNWQI